MYTLRRSKQEELSLMGFRGNCIHLRILPDVETMLEIVVEMGIDDHIRVGQVTGFVKIAIDLWKNIC